MTDNPSISARTIEALTAIATGLHDIADAVRETGRAGEGQIATQEPAGATQGGSGDSRASGGLGERLRAAADYQDRPGAHDELRAMADEADRLERERDGARIKGEQWKARYEEARGELRVVDGMLASKPDESENPFRMPEDRAPATDWAKVDHTADQCQFEECPACGCCAHGKEHVIGCSTTLDRPLGTDCPNPDCACKGGMG